MSIFLLNFINLFPRLRSFTLKCHDSLEELNKWEKVTVYTSSRGREKIKECKEKMFMYWIANHLQDEELHAFNFYIQRLSCTNHSSAYNFRLIYRARTNQKLSPKGSIQAALKVRVYTKSQILATLFYIGKLKNYFV